MALFQKKICSCVFFIILLTSANMAIAQGITLSISGDSGPIKPGSVLPITVTPDIGTNIVKLFVAAPNTLINVVGPPYATTITVSSDIAGKFQVAAFGQTSTNEIYSDLITLTVVPVEPLGYLLLEPSHLTLEQGDLAQIGVYGDYDGVKRNLQGLGTGTTFISFNPRVATVDENGLVNAKVVGSCLITVKNQDKTVDLLVNVVANFGNAYDRNTDYLKACGGGPYAGVTSVPMLIDATCSLYSFPSKLKKFEWDWNNDGTYDEQTDSMTIYHTWDNPYDGEIKLRVTDFYNRERVTAILVKIQPRLSVISTGAYFLMEGYRGVVAAKVEQPFGTSTPVGYIRFNYRNSTLTVNLVSTSIQVLDRLGSTETKIKGTCTVNYQPGYLFVMSVTDAGSPGTKKDIIGIDIMKPDGSYYFGVPQRMLSGGDLIVKVN